MMTKRNPKQDGSNVFDCKPQSGPCPIGCNQCFYNRDGAFYVDIHAPHMPTLEEVGDGIMRVNSGHDSNIEREKSISESAIYPKRFFNTSIPKFDFPAPVVWTANPQEEKPVPLVHIPDNVMFIRLRVSSTNYKHIAKAIRYYHDVAPIVLTFMAYYDEEPENADNYVWKQRHINSYWCPTRDFMARVISAAKGLTGVGRGVVMCSDLDAYDCKSCRNCETYYYQTIKHMKENA